MPRNARSLLLLDRDGTLITEQDYLKDPRKVRLLSGVAPALRKLSQAGFALVVISNQSGVGRGLMTRADVDRVHKRFDTLLRQQGVRLSGIYWCPHRPDQHCSCRKPGLELVKKASKDLGLSWRKSISVGDKWSDVALGQRTGGRGILVKTGYGLRTLREKGRHRKPAYIAKNFGEAARWILKTEKKESNV